MKDTNAGKGAKTMKIEQNKYKRWFIRFDEGIIGDGDDAFWSEEDAQKWWDKHSNEAGNIAWKQVNV